MQNNTVLPSANSAYTTTLIAKLERLIKEVKEGNEKSEARLVSVLTRLFTTYPNFIELPANLFTAISAASGCLKAVGYKLQWSKNVADFQVTAVSK